MTMSSQPTVLKLSCSVRNYAWGKIGLSSKVAQLKRSSDRGYLVDENEPYAELWMGVHPKAPSTILYPQTLKGVALGAWLESNRWALGEPVDQLFEGQLPFLFKVLSINKALSIQAHPTKAMAFDLHSTDPDKYPDPNHKPEMVIALTSFKGLCGFRPFNEIKKFITSIPELSNIMSGSSLSYISNGGMDNTKQAIKKCFKDLMDRNEDIIADNLSKLVNRLRQNGTGSDDILTVEEVNLLLKLYSWFPNDVGCFCLFFMNVVSLVPGQAMFLGPNIPHAYISGDVIECMANSDNVVRAGLTPKFKDKETLCEMLLYHSKPPHEQLFKSKPHPQSPDSITLYDPPIADFSIARIEVNEGSTNIPVVKGPSIIIVIEGSGNISVKGSDEISYCQGEVLFIAAMNMITIIPSTKTTLYQGFCQL